MTYICFDVGGTILKSAVVSDGVVGTIFSRPALSGEDQATILANFCAAIDELAENEPKIDGLRFAFPGNFDYENGICLIKGVAKYESIYGMNLKEYFTRYMNESHCTRLSKDFSCCFENDVTAVALGAIAKHRRAQKGKFFTMCIGTGCGSAFAADGKIVTKGEGIPENGWVYPLPLCGKTFDEVLSVRGFKKISLAAFKAPLDGYEVSQRADAGDKKAVRVFKEFSADIGAAIAYICKSFAPATILLGGGIMKSYNLLAEEIEHAATQYGVSLIIADDTTKLALSGIAQL